MGGEKNEKKEYIVTGCHRNKRYKMITWRELVELKKQNKNKNQKIEFQNKQD